jgi:hypothetical protein
MLWTLENDETMTNFITRKHARKWEKRKQRARTEVQASKQPKRDVPHTSKGPTKHQNLHPSVVWSITTKERFHNPNKTPSQTFEKHLLPCTKRGVTMYQSWAIICKGHTIFGGWGLYITCIFFKAFKEVEQANLLLLIIKGISSSISRVKWYASDSTRRNSKECNNNK